MEYEIKELISQSQIASRVKALGDEIRERYKETDELVIVGLLRGAFVFLADLAREMNRPSQIDFMTTSSYGSGMESARNVRIVKDLEDDIHQRDVLLVDDIVDTGHTLQKVSEVLNSRNPRSLSICVLLDKPSRRERVVNIDWVGFSIPDTFVIGYGIDYAGAHRELPYIGEVVKTTD
ncbi:MAG: hypoxanthine phosphoribosyltransferase [Arenicellales bacterium]|jgi:hypoxanthine phosphoribosyltransferase|nr:hypoxanthine phosphoribosyltransferase [Acidiferrobacteraceae bacterium]MDP6122779.1 hypoxanthine phosphoribosyltransferase [Arenicellales bacterium]MBT58031.1 hypoxanthine phosphoribosyltransferase [Acidiferrobacteraceae bacterium]MDP6290047.1 hypoxanthine phosphoribosyltransferase [Arenicellales bacterium]MDP6435081.1 hypoxanthine phosphoribosyltransferase [Arenicellales bacterium]|tara:strand:+ start:141 stop:674 length:534 start_codon:yes stop_codon:yes gene_type:complete